MPQMMEHPQHGRCYANDGEISSLSNQGWVIATPKMKIDPVVEEPIYPQAEKPRLGRPPKNTVGNDHGNSTNTRR